MGFGERGTQNSYLICRPSFGDLGKRRYPVVLRVQRRKSSEETVADLVVYGLSGLSQSGQMGVLRKDCDKPCRSGRNVEIVATWDAVMSKLANDFLQKRGLARNWLCEGVTQYSDYR